MANRLTGGMMRERSLSRGSSDEEGTTSNRRRRGGVAILSRLRGGRGGGGTSGNNSSSNSSNNNNHTSNLHANINHLADLKKGGNSNGKESRVSVLDALQTLRVRGSSRSLRDMSVDSDDDDDRTLLTTGTPSLASTVSTFSSTSSAAPFGSRDYKSFGQTGSQAFQMGSQNHRLPSLSSTRPFDCSQPIGGGRHHSQSVGLRSIGQSHPRTSSPQGGARAKVHKRIRTKGGPPSSLYSAVSSGAPRNVVESLLQNDPSAPSHPNHGGMTPLHCAIERYDSKMDMLLLMLASDPSAAGLRNADGLNSVDLLWKRFIDPAVYRSDTVKTAAASLRRLMEEIVNSSFSMHRQSRAEHALQENEVLQEFFSTITTFIKAACQGSMPGLRSGTTSHDYLLHDCVKLECDPLMIRFVATLYPEQVRETTAPEEHRRLPLHLAAMQSPRILSSVLELCPYVAAQPDGEGRLPLHLAIENGISWEDGLDALVRASPKALTTPDPVSKLLPAMQAGAGDDLTTIYGLLSEDPMEVMSFALGSI